MDYTEFEISISPFSEEIAEILIAELAEAGFESFTESESGIKAYAPENKFDLKIIEAILISNRFAETKLSYQVVTIKAQNWNALWESNFEPIVINNNLLVKAPFHTIEGHYNNTIIIEPKMSFGTGHHETTSLMLELMHNYDFKNKCVLDMGCGTGILAIYAHQLGATDITAIDIDEWAYQNCIENFERNNCKQITALIGDAGVIPNKQYDLIIANINRNVLLTDIEIYARFLKKRSFLFLSGFYTSDIELIKNAANTQNMELQEYKEKKNWVACVFKAN